MDAEKLEKLLQGVKAGTVSLKEAQEALTRLPFTDLGYARVDHHRQLRQGLPEVVFGVNKTAEQLVGIIQALLAAGQNILVTRVDAAKAEAVRAELPQLGYHAGARTLSFRSSTPACPLRSPVAIVTAGTSD